MGKWVVDCVYQFGNLDVRSRSSKYATSGLVSTYNFSMHDKQRSAKSLTKANVGLAMNGLKVVSALTTAMQFVHE